jgi:hypothetical protein
VGASAGYRNDLPISAGGVATAEVVAGGGDLRESRRGLWPDLWWVSLSGDAGPKRGRVGLGVATAYAPLAGWEHDWSPTFTVGVRALQGEFLPTGPALSFGPFISAGAAFYSDRATRQRTAYTVSLGAEYWDRQRQPSLFSLFVMVGFLYGNSIGPTS